MPTQLQFRRGTTSQNATFVGSAGELTVDSTLKTIRVHDGVTPGGSPLLAQNTTTQPATFSTLTVSGISNLDTVSLTDNLSVSGLHFQSTDGSATASGTTQTNAYVITKQITVFTVVPGGGQGARLPAIPSLGSLIYISNRGVNNLILWPQSGGSIDGASINTSIIIAPNAYWVGVSSSVTAWTSIVGTFSPAANQITVSYASGQPLLSLDNNIIFPGTITTNSGNLSTFNGNITAASTSTATFNGPVIVSTTGSVVINATTANSGTNSTSGALQVKGGLGVGGAIYADGVVYSAGSAVLTSASGGYNGGTITGQLVSTNITDSISVSTGSINTTGGLGVALNMSVGGNITITGYGIQANIPTIPAHVANKQYVDTLAIGLACALS